MHRKLSLLVVVAASLFLAANDSPKRIARRPSITQERAEAIVWALPEIKAWAKYIAKHSKGTVHAATMVEPETPVTINGKRYWSVNFYEDQPDHFHRWQSFMVRLDSKEILVDTAEPDDYLSLREWRAKEHPMERIRD